MTKSGTIITLILAVTAAVLFSEDFDPISHIRQELEKGNRYITVPAGTYILESQDRAPYLSLKDVQDTVIDLTGVKFIGSKQYTMISLSECKNVTVKGLVMDYLDLPFTQGIITDVDEDRNWTIEIIDGYPCFDVPSGDACWPIQVYDQTTLELINPMRFRSNIQVVKTGDRTYRITGGNDRRGEKGDIVVFTIHDPSYEPVICACVVSKSIDCTLEDIVIYSTPNGPGVFDSSSTRTTLSHCRLIRCPQDQDIAPRGLKRLRSGNHDAYMCRCAHVGPRIINCTALYHCDDCVNISGYCGVIFGCDGQHLRMATHLKNPPVQPGETAQIITADGNCVEGLAIRSVTPASEMTDEEKAMLQTVGFWGGFETSCTNMYDVELAERPDFEITQGSFISSENANGNGFIIRGCHFGRNRGQGILLRASNGVIENNFIDYSWGPGIGCEADVVWLESGSSSNVTIVGNVIIGNLGGAIRIGGSATHGKQLKPNAHKNIRIFDNWISGPRTGIVLRGCTNAEVRDNRFQLEDGQKSIFLMGNCESCTIEYPPKN